MASETSAPVPEAAEAEAEGFLTAILNEIISSPLNLALVAVIIYLVFKIFKSRNETPVQVAPEPQLPKLRRDFTVEELKKYDGNGSDGRILVAVNGKVFDVTKGKRFYGPGTFGFTSLKAFARLTCCQHDGLLGGQGNLLPNTLALLAVHSIKFNVGHSSFEGSCPHTWYQYVSVHLMFLFSLSVFRYIIWCKI